jgi:hypothetical protein
LPVRNPDTVQTFLSFEQFSSELTRGVGAFKIKNSKAESSTRMSVLAVVPPFNITSVQHRETGCTTLKIHFNVVHLLAGEYKVGGTFPEWRQHWNPQTASPLISYQARIVDIFLYTV